MKTPYMLILATLMACNETEPPEIFNGNQLVTNSDEWLIPRSEILDGGPGKDGIPAIDNPQFSVVGDIDFLDDEDLIVGIKIGDSVKAYPHEILDWHEIVNDQIDDTYFAMTYCPLTGTAIAWNRKFEGEVTTFGVSGFLYNSNLLPFDRSTDSYWSQMLNLSVNGDLIGTQAERIQVVETNWRTWKLWYDNSEIQNTNTSFNRNYGVYPYGSYKENNTLIFPVANLDERLHLKERVLGVEVGEKSIVFPIQDFNEPKSVETNLNGARIVAIGNLEQNWIVAFENPRIQEQDLQLRYYSEQENILNSKAIAVDQFSNLWSPFGLCLKGPNEGSRIENAKSYIGYWFAWAAFHPEVIIHQD